MDDMDMFESSAKDVVDSTEEGITLSLGSYCGVLGYSDPVLGNGEVLYHR